MPQGKKAFLSLFFVPFFPLPGQGGMMCGAINIEKYSAWGGKMADVTHTQTKIMLLRVPIRIIIQLISSRARGCVFVHAFVGAFVGASVRMRR